MTYPAFVSVDTRDCRLYRFYGLDPATNYTTKRLIYVGETVRQPFARLMEHVNDQPWIDTVTSWEVDDRVFAGKDMVLEAEAKAIRKERPLYNIKENEQFRQRVKPWDAVAQRHARDDARGLPRWVSPKARPPVPPRPPAKRSPRPAARRPARPPRLVLWKPWQVIAGCWISAWAIMAGWLWNVMAGASWATGSTRVWVAGLTPVVALLWGFLAGRRVWRRIRRWLR